MNTTAHYALVIAIVSGVTGALVVCLLTFAYGFTSDDGPAAAVRRRRSISRVGQGLAGVSFGLAAIAAMVGLVAASRASAAVEQRVQTLHGRVTGLVSTLHRLGEATDRLQTLVPPRDRVDAQPPEAATTMAAGGAVATPRPVRREDWPRGASVAVRDGDLARDRASGFRFQNDAPVSSALTPQPAPTRVTEPIEPAVPREPAPGASDAKRPAPETPPVLPLERVEQLQPPAPPSEAPSVSIAPVPRVPTVVEGPRASELDAAPAPAVRPPSIEQPAGLHRRDRPEQPQRASRGERGDRIERRERVDRTDGVASIERVERRERIERPETVERPERVERPDRVDRVERPERRERQERVERVERRERGERPERVERRERGERIERPERRGGRD